MVLRKLVSIMLKNEIKTLPNIIHKNKLKMDHRRKCKARHDKTLRGKQAEGYLTFVVVQPLSLVWLFVTPQTAACQASLSLPSPGACSDSCLLSQRYHPTNISSVPFSSCPQSFPTSGSFLMSWHFASGHQSIRASALASVLLMNIHDWFPLGLTGLISLESKGS